VLTVGNDARLSGKTVREHWEKARKVGQVAANLATIIAALDRNKELADDNARLRRHLARALGDKRSARTRTGNDQGG
jgi:hypothetical protein